MVKLRRLSHKIETPLLAGLFACAVLFSIYVFSVGFSHTILDMHGFRQTQTALSAQFLVRDWHWLTYETPLFGPPWKIPMEFPFYQQVTAVLAMLTGWDVASCGRLVSMLFYYLTLWPIYLFLSALAVAPRYRFVFMTLYLLSPQHLFWGRTVLIESCALFLAVLYVSAVLRWLQSRAWHWLAVAGVAGVLGAAVKFTTFFAFGLVAAGFCIWFLLPVLQKNWRQGLTDGTTALTWFAAIPFFCLLAFTSYADQLKAANPFSMFITSAELQNWNFGSLAQRLDDDLWYMFFRNTIHDAIGHRTLFILLCLAVAGFRRSWRVFALSVALFLVPPLVFTNLHIQHNYYAYANCLFLCFGAAWVIVSFLRTDDYRHYIGLALLLLAIVFPAREWHRRYYQVQQRNLQDVLNIKKLVQAKTDFEDVLLVFNAGWDPSIAFYTNRRVIMSRTGEELPTKDWQTILARFDQRQIGGLLFCGHLKDDQAFIDRQLAFLTSEFVRERLAFNCRLYHKKTK